MSSNFKDLLKAFSPEHDDMEEQAVPDSTSEIYTETYKPAKQPVKKCQSVIQSDMIVHGSIETKSDIEVAGIIDGNISSEGMIVVNGIVSGSISGLSVAIGAKELNADINAKENISIDQNTTINGNISAGNISVGGVVNGNINAENGIIIKSSAVITGDIRTSSIEVSRGAVINGNVSFIKKEAQ